MNKQRRPIREHALYECELGYNDTETTKLICCEKSSNFSICAAEAVVRKVPNLVYVPPKLLWEKLIKVP